MHGHGHGNHGNPRQLELNDMNLQAASGKVPPSWGPEHEKSYPFRYYESDALLWCLSNADDQAHKGPALAQRLTGSAKMIVRELDPQFLVNGQVVMENGQPVQLNGVQWLLRLIRRRFAPLDQEAQLHSISEFFNFQRQSHEDTDQVIARFEFLSYRALHVGQAQLNEIVLSWMLLHHMRIPRDRWPIILGATGGNLPVDAQQYQEFLLYLRRNGHLYDRTADPAKNVAGFFYEDSTQLQSFPAEHAFPTFASEPAYGQTYYDSVETASLSSGNSNDDSLVDISDLAHLSYAQAAETAYLGFRVHKRRWRKFAGPRRSKGKGKGKFKSTGKSSTFRPKVLASHFLEMNTKLRQSKNGQLKALRPSGTQHILEGRVSPAESPGRIPLGGMGNACCAAHPDVIPKTISSRIAPWVKARVAPAVKVPLSLRKHG